MRRRGKPIAGIVFCHAQKSSLRELIGALSFLAVGTKPENLANKVEYL
jgi:hypothetical protein